MHCKADLEEGYQYNGEDVSTIAAHDEVTFQPWSCMVRRHFDGARLSNELCGKYLERQYMHFRRRPIELSIIIRLKRESLTE